MLITIIGILAAALTSLSYIPQVKKALPAGSTDDLSSKTLAVLAAGLALWTVRHPQKRFVIIVANAVGR
jgi:MtN3 and saliva related transmembrane protein